MELTIRDWMVIVGAGLILAVLVDAARRVLKDRRDAVRLNAKVKRRGEPDEGDEFNLLTELPNGGARIVSRDDLNPPPEMGDPLLDPTPIATPPPKAVFESRSPAYYEGEEPEQLPGEGIDYPRDAADGEPEAVEDPAAVAAKRKMVDAIGETVEPVAAPTPSFTALDEAGDDLDAVPAATEALVAAGSPEDPPPVDGAPETLDWLDQLDAPEPEPEPEAKLPRGIDPHVFVLNVIARSEIGFSGRDILSILLACDLRFGDMDFFHRHEQKAGRGPIQFSVANMMKPGVFDIDTMDALQTRGLMFFVTLPGPEDMLKAFDYMYETAKTVARNLNGDVLDETRSAVTRQSIDHMRQQIRELERRIAMEQAR